jgi:hypothetical protein
MSNRHYRTRRNRVAYFPLWLCTVVIALIVALVPRGPAAIHVGAAIALVVLLWLGRNIYRLGINLTDDGITVYGAVRTRHVAWREVVAVETHRWMGGEIADLALSNGRRVNTNLIQGAPVSWAAGEAAGETTDIVSELTSAVANHRVNADFR